jgi:hypothetical protein
MLLLASGCTSTLFDKPEFSMPSGGLLYPVAAPTAPEQEGVVLRLRPANGQVVHYSIQSVAFVTHTSTMTKWARGTGQDQATEVWNVDSVPEQFSVNQSTAMGKLQPGVFTLNSRYRLVAIASGMSVDNANSSLVFPEGAVKAGSTWSCVPAPRPDGRDDSPPPKRMDWKCLGFADALGRRCAVLETKFQTQKETREAFVTTDHRDVIYIDCKAGIPVLKVMEADATAGPVLIKSQTTTKIND